MGRKKKPKPNAFTVVVEYYGGPQDGHTKVIHTEVDPFEPEALPEQIEFTFEVETPSGQVKSHYHYTKGTVNRTTGVVAGYKASYYYKGSIKDNPS